MTRSLTIRAVRPRRAVALVAAVLALTAGLSVAQTPGAQAATTGAGATGVPAGTSLTVVNGDQTISKDGTVLSGLDIRGRVLVRANNVTIKNSIIRGTSGAKWGIVDAMSGKTGLKITDTEIVASSPNWAVNGIMGWNFELTRVNIHNVVDAVHIAGSNVIVKDSWLHGNTWFAYDPNHSDGSHDDSVQIVGGSNIRLSGNTMEGASNVGIMITQDRSTTSNVTVENNKLASGDCTINISTGGKGAMKGMVVNYNLFDTRTSVKRCAVYSPVGTVSMTGNKYIDGIAAVLRTS
jgi:hypothetical protein